jgi:hypothetical protein
MSTTGNPVEPHSRNELSTTLVAAIAAFCTYFCMYAFRKPFSAATYEGQVIVTGLLSHPLPLKTLLILSQLAGYMLSKFIGVKVISETPRSRRAVTMIGLMTFAEITLIGLAYLPVPLKIVMLFFNGLALGMVFGLVLAYLEGRKMTEALAAGLCASFIFSSGFVKSVGRTMIEQYGVSEYAMPYVTGLLFYGPMLFFVWLLQRTPEPGLEDRALRSERTVMTRQQRKDFVQAYFPGLVALLAVYVGLTIIRTLRDDFGVEIWRALGVDEEPSVFARSELVVAVLATAANGFAIWIVHNLTAFRVTTLLMTGGFATILLAALGQTAGLLSPFHFMVLCGVGLYVPYVAYHTTIFERLLAASRRPGNLGFLMYLADSIGYLGYAVVMVWKTMFPPEDAQRIFASFWTMTVVIGILSIGALVFANAFFQRALADVAPVVEPVPVEEVSGS